MIPLQFIVRIIVRARRYLRNNSCNKQRKRCLSESEDDSKRERVCVCQGKRKIARGGEKDEAR